MVKARERQEAIDEATRALRRAMGATFGRTRRTLAQRGVSRQQFFVLKVLAGGEVTTTKELAQALCVTPANITGLVEKLQRTGFVRRERDAQDRRIVRLRLTRKAELGLKALKESVQREAAKAFEGWTNREIEAFTKMLNRLAGDWAPQGAWGGWNWGKRGPALSPSRRSPRGRP